MRYWLVVLAASLVACGGGNSSNPDAQPVVEDTTPPVITLIGDNPQIIEAGEDYTELGATATDNIDGNLAASIVIDASTVETTVPGDYTVSYNVTDAAGNAAITVTRTVTVRDTTPPVITLLGDNPQVIITGNPYMELGATAADSLDGDLTASIVIDANAVDIEVVGNYSVSYNVSDAAGNAAATETRTVRVQAPPLPAAPTVSIEGDIKKLAFSWNAVAGVENYRLLENADGHSGFTQVGDDIPADTLTATLDIAVHLFDWVGAQYIVEACNLSGCNSSSVISATDVMLDAIGYFKASNTDSGDEFGGVWNWDEFGWYGGVSLSFDGRTLAIGAPHEQSAATGIGGDELDNSVDYAGAVYVFRRSDLGWFQQAYIKGEGTAFEWFGNAVALSGDGDTLAVGSPEKGFHVYQFANRQWTEQSINITNSRCNDVGVSIAISQDGSVIVAGNPLDANYRLGVGGMIEPIPPPLYEESPYSGAVCVFIREGSEWWDDVYIKPSDTHDGMMFGSTATVNTDGTTIVIGAPYNPGAAYVFRSIGGTWFEEARLRGSNTEDQDLFGAALSTSGDGNSFVASAMRYSSDLGGGDNSGASYIFSFDGEEWVERSLIRPPNLDPQDYFGTSVSLDSSGTILAVGARSEDSSAIAIGGDALDNSSTSSGAVYVFVYRAGEWMHQSYVKASNTEALDHFGRATSLSGDGKTLAVAASGEDSQATGVNGVQLDNNAPDSGAVYLY